MNSPTHRAVTADESDGEITLGILNAVEENSRVTQRSVAGELGIALGLANAYLKRCVRKGLVKVQQIPSNRYAYYLTPQGFAEKSRLTSEYLTSSFQFFRRARQECEELLEECEANDRLRLGLLGVSDLAEVLALAALDSDVELVGVADSSVKIDRFAGMKVVRDVSQLDAIDALVITDLRQPQGKYDAARKSVGGTPVLHVPLLRISDNQTDDDSGTLTSLQGDEQ